MRVYDSFFGLPSLRRARKVVVITANETKWLSARGVPEERIAEIPNGVDDDAFRPRDPQIARSKWGLSRYVVFVGRLYREKGPTLLVDALARIAEKHPDVSVVLAGPDHGEASVARERARTLGLERRVVLTGPVTEEEKLSLLAGSDCLALPTFWEAQGIAFLEAWAQGRPVVGTTVGGIPYVVDHEKDGLLVPAGDVPALSASLDAILSDRKTADRMGNAGREKARARYRWDVLSPRLEAVYEAAAGED